VVCWPYLSLSLPPPPLSLTVCVCVRLQRLQQEGLHQALGALLLDKQRQQPPLLHTIIGRRRGVRRGAGSVGSWLLLATTRPAEPNTPSPAASGAATGLPSLRTVVR
jgi:hypothetical protein